MSSVANVFDGVPGDKRAAVGKTVFFPSNSFFHKFNLLNRIRDDEGISGTDLKPRFYEHLETFACDQQVFVVDNTEPPPSFVPNAKHFRKNPASPRFGLLPYLNTPDEPAATG